MLVPGRPDCSGEYGVVVAVNDIKHDNPVKDDPVWSAFLIQRQLLIYLMVVIAIVLLLFVFQFMEQEMLYYK